MAERVGHWTGEILPVCLTTRSEGFMRGCFQGKNVHDARNNAMLGQRKRGIMCLNVELAEVRPWLRLASPKVQRKSPSWRRLNRNRNARGILRVRPQPPRTAANSTPRYSSTPSAKAEIG